MYPVAFDESLAILVFKWDPKLHCSSIAHHLGESLP